MSTTIAGSIHAWSIRLTAMLSLPMSVIASGCGDPTASGPAVSVRTLSTVREGVVGTTLPQPFEVEVVGLGGRPLPLANVSFRVASGDARFSVASARTNGKGIARATVTLGSTAGPVELSASVTGAWPATLSVTAKPGPAVRISVSPRSVQLDSFGLALFRVSAEDRLRNRVPTGTVTWTSLDPSLFSVSTDGMVTAVQAGRSGRLLARAGAHSDTAWVSVADPAASPCLGYAAPRTIAAGEVVLTDPATFAICIRGETPDAEYVAVPVHMSVDAHLLAQVELSAAGITPLPAQPPAMVPGGTPAADAELLLMENDRALSRHWPAARRSHARRLEARAADPGWAAAIPSAAVGATVQVYANLGVYCADAPRTARVMAIGQQAILLEDVARPEGGASISDYQRYSAEVDRLVWPVVTSAFGAPTDVDGNGRVVILFTPAVNAASLVGFFSGKDALTREQCATSNEGEIVSIFVADPTGTIIPPSGSPRRYSRAYADSFAVPVIAHELQHLINSFRRAYVLEAAFAEETWLNEGLSHIAEELLFQHESGLPATSNVGIQHVATEPALGQYRRLARWNIARLGAFLESSHVASPFDGNSTPTRGAIWSFLRYAADHRTPGDARTWSRLTNTTATGMHNLRATFGPDILELERDWLVSLLMDDLAGTDARYTQPSWNMRSLRVVPGHPPRVQPLNQLSGEFNILAAGGAAYYAFGVGPGSEALVRLTSEGLRPNGRLQFLVARTR